MVIRIEKKSHVATLSNFFEAEMEPQHCVLHQDVDIYKEVYMKSACYQLFTTGEIP